MNSNHLSNSSSSFHIAEMRQISSASSAHSNSTPICKHAVTNASVNCTTKKTKQSTYDASTITKLVTVPSKQNGLNMKNKKTAAMESAIDGNVSLTGLTERQQIALLMKLTNTSSSSNDNNDNKIEKSKYIESDDEDDAMLKPKKKKSKKIVLLPSKNMKSKKNKNNDVYIDQSNLVELNKTPIINHQTYLVEPSMMLDPVAEAHLQNVNGDIKVTKKRGKETKKETFMRIEQEQLKQFVDGGKEEAYSDMDIEEALVNRPRSTNDIMKILKPRAEFVFASTSNDEPTKMESETNDHDNNNNNSSSGSSDINNHNYVQQKFSVGDVVIVETVGKDGGPAAGEGEGIARVVKVYEGEDVYDVKYVVLKFRGKRIPGWRMKLSPIFGYPVLSNILPEKIQCAVSFVESSHHETLKADTSLPLRLTGLLDSEEISSDRRTATPTSMIVNDEHSEGLSDVHSTASSSALIPINSSHWVRRSTRHAGTDQLQREDVKELLLKLESNSPDLKILRLKNWLQADTNSLVLSQVLNLLERNNIVQVLYIQCFNDGMDDTRLMHLIRVLKNNPRIWALNVGENFKITRQGWEAFANELRSTHVTHLYAGSESTVYGDLKVKMRDAIRENRSKHDLHCSEQNFDVISQVGQMWWNPRCAKKLQHLACKLQDSDDTDQKSSPEFVSKAEATSSLVGLNILLPKRVFTGEKCGKSSGLEEEWVLGRVAKIGKFSMRLVALFNPIHQEGKNEPIRAKWINVDYDVHAVGRELKWGRVPDSDMWQPCQIYAIHNSSANIPSASVANHGESCNILNESKDSTIAVNATKKEEGGHGNETNGDDNGLHLIAYFGKNVDKMVHWLPSSELRPFSNDKAYPGNIDIEVNTKSKDLIDGFHEAVSEAMSEYTWRLQRMCKV